MEGAGIPWKVLAQAGDGGLNHLRTGRAEGARRPRAQPLCGEPLEKERAGGTATSLPLGPRACLEVPGSPPWLEVMEPRLSPEPSSGGAPHFLGWRPGEPKAGLRPLAVCDAGTLATLLGPRGADVSLQGRRAVTVPPGPQTEGRAKRRESPLSESAGRYCISGKGTHLQDVASCRVHDGDWTGAQCGVRQGLRGGRQREGTWSPSQVPLQPGGLRKEAARVWSGGHASNQSLTHGALRASGHVVPSQGPAGSPWVPSGPHPFCQKTGRQHGHNLP